MALSKTGVLLVNLGTPRSYQRSDVYRYLKEFLLDPRVIDIPPLQRNLLVRGIIAPFRSGSSAKLYKEIWTEEGSPLMVISQKAQHLVQEALGDEYEVELSMRYQSPSIKQGLEALRAKNVREIIIFPMFPQYASATTGSIHQRVMEEVANLLTIPPIRFINSYYDHPQFIEAFVERGKTRSPETYDHVIFSYHGLPERQILKADRNNHCLRSDDCCAGISIKNQFCYRAQCFATTRALAERLDLSENNYTTSFQSRLGKEPWIQPYTNELIANLAAQGVKKVLVFCPAFVTDCLETIHEIGVEYKEEFLKAGGEELQLVESLNDHPLWISAIVDLMKLG